MLRGALVDPDILFALVFGSVTAGTAKAESDLWLAALPLSTWRLRQGGLGVPRDLAIEILCP